MFWDEDFTTHAVRGLNIQRSHGELSCEIISSFPVSGT